jgi:hypothetical protein
LGGLVIALGGLVIALGRIVIALGGIKLALPIFLDNLNIKPLTYTL